MLRLENITGGYDATRDILNDASLQVARGESVGIIGLNGSGKSTLGRAILNRLPRRAGRVFLDGNDVTTLPTARLIRRGVAGLLQGAPVFDRLTVAENLRLAADGDPRLLDEFQKRHTTGFSQFFAPAKTGGNSTDAACDAGPNLHRRHADKLSGGQRHMLALACALVRQPKLLLLDEPSAGLAPAAAAALYKTLAEIRDATGVTILLIEQNVAFARAFCRRVLIMRQGRLHEMTSES